MLWRLICSKYMSKSPIILYVPIRCKKENLYMTKNKFPNKSRVLFTNYDKIINIIRRK